jgi:hypothetical protein
VEAVDVGDMDVGSNNLSVACFTFESELEDKLGGACKRQTEGDCFCDCRRYCHIVSVILRYDFEILTGRLSKLDFFDWAIGVV